MKNKFRKRDLLIFNLVLSIFSMVCISYVFLVALIISLFIFDNYEIHQHDSVFPPFLSLPLVIGISLIVSLLLTIFVSKRFLRPIDELKKGMNEVKNGNFNVQIENEYENEVKELIDNFNIMTRELKMNETLKTDFISSVSHEFKTPLSSIQGYATLLQDDTLSKEDKDKYIKYIIDATQKLNVLVSNILKISKIDNQNIVIEPTTFSLDEQIREVILLLEKEWTNKNIELDIDLERIDIKSDKNLLNNVWTNLINNAIKFSKENSKIIIKCFKENDNIKVIVKDFGIGIKEENLPYIFNKFYQGDTSHASEGNGLGLSIVKGIITLVGGEIEVISKEEVGSEFIVTL